MSDAQVQHCTYHHRTPAVATCSMCASGVCGVCVKTANSTAFCSGCGVGRETQKPWLAAAFSLFLPGAGQVYNGDLGKAVVVFLLAPLVLPWLWGIYDAATIADKIARGARDASTVPTGGVLLGLKIVWVPMALLYGALVSVVLAAILGGVQALLS